MINGFTGVKPGNVYGCQATIRNFVEKIQSGAVE